ncbi:MAG: FAD-dependent oxidoreductase [Bacteroidota bacterium]
MTIETTIGKITGKRVAVIGAGPAGMAAAGSLASLGIIVEWYEKDSKTGGKLNDFFKLFPDQVPASEILPVLKKSPGNSLIKNHLGITISGIEKQQNRIVLFDGKESCGEADAVILATGFDFFDARLKEEFGYGMYKHVVTSVDLEKMLPEGPDILRYNGKDPLSVGFVHCVGSRDEQVGVSYCSRLCCITGIKQAIEIKELLPSARVYNFYIDIRAFGKGFEELYREAQEVHGVRFIRGRVSEASEDQDQRIRVKAEDTLMARPMKLTVDWLVLLVGMIPACTSVNLNNVENHKEFIKPENPLICNAVNGMPGVFAAGCCTGPMNIPESVASGRAAAIQAIQYLSGLN